jgi:hypothetical protein
MGRKYPYILVATRAECRERKISLHSIQKIMTYNKYPFIDTDALTSLNCNRPFLGALKYLTKVAEVRGQPGKVAWPNHPPAVEESDHVA